MIEVLKVPRSSIYKIVSKRDDVEVSRYTFSLEKSLIKLCFADTTELTWIVVVLLAKVVKLMATAAIKTLN